MGWGDRPDGFGLVGRIRGASPSGGEAEEESGNWCAWCLSWSGMLPLFENAEMSLSEDRSH